MTITNEQLDEIEARAEAATDGPWETHDNDSVYHQHYVYLRGPRWAANGSMVRADAELVAHARQDVPALVAEVRRLRGVLERIANHEIAGADVRPSDTHSDVMARMAREALEGGND